MPPTEKFREFLLYLGLEKVRNVSSHLHLIKSRRDNF